MRKLTHEQAEMVAFCLMNDKAWCTAPSSPNHMLLDAWEERGWTVKVDPPASADFLVAYEFTDAGRKALEAQDA